ncbi:MAG: hypothetical protein R2722_13290 [Tessaracoccus sp.]
MDQPFWAERMSRGGSGETRPLDERRVTASAVRAALDEVASSLVYGELRACRDFMAEEDSVEDAVEVIENLG